MLAHRQQPPSGAYRVPLASLQAGPRVTLEGEWCCGGLSLSLSFPQDPAGKRNKFDPGPALDCLGPMAVQGFPGKERLRSGQQSVSELGQAAGMGGHRASQVFCKTRHKQVSSCCLNCCILNSFDFRSSQDGDGRKVPAIPLKDSD